MWSNITHANAETPMLLAACAVEDVNVRDAGFFDLVARVESFYLVVFWMTAAGGNLLVLFKCFDKLGWDQITEFRNREASTGEMVRHVV